MKQNQTTKTFKAYCDGLCEPNPGNATWAFMVFEHSDTTSQLVFREFGALPGRKSNNDAEYVGFGKALSHILQAFPKGSLVELHSDSQLVLKQVSGEWSCNHEHLRRYRTRCRELIQKIETKGIILSRHWIKGSENPADELTREAYRQAHNREPPKRH